MDRWHAYIGSDTGFDPAGHLAALVGEGFDIEATQVRRDARKTELIAARLAARSPGAAAFTCG